MANRVIKEARLKLGTRARSCSLPARDEFLKRKRKEEDINKGVEDCFKKSKKTFRSPEKNNYEEEVSELELTKEEMETILKELKGLRGQMTKMEENRLSDMETIKAEIKKRNEEVIEELAKRDKLWQVEKAEMKAQMEVIEKRIILLEKKQEWTDSKERRKNIIVTLELSEDTRKNRVKLKEEIQNNDI